MFLGLAAVVGGGIIAAVVLLFGDDNAGTSACDSSLAPIGESDISQRGFQQEDEGLTSLIEAAQAEDLDAANQAFFGDDSRVHNFTHNIDPQVRAVDEQLARELCQAVISLEERLARGEADRTAAAAARVRELVRDAAEALGYARPGG